MHLLGVFCFDFSDVNECSKGIDSCNKTSSDCVDAEGSYRCSCKPGYNQGANNKICVGTLP